MQGIRREEDYIITDPAICSLNKEYGPTDFGKDCIFNFFYKHECSEFCSNYNKPSEFYKSNLKISKNTTYR